MRPKARSKDIVVQNVGAETLVYDLMTHTACHLNETSATVWRLCDGTRTVGEISAELSRRSKARVTDETVHLALDQLSTKDLLESAPEPLAGLHGSSRREVLKRVAMSSAIALPVIASIVVPTAAQAQSVVCTACVKFNTGAVCGGCVNVVGTCYENAGCGGGLATPGVTCGNCQSAVGACAGGTGTCSWRQV